MKPAILLSIAFACWITTGYEQTKPSSLKLMKACFTCDTAAEGTIFCDDFETGKPLTDRYFEYDNNDDKGWWYKTKLKCANKLIFNKWR